MISSLLLMRIAQLFLALILGWVLVKAKILKSEDSRVLSALALYAAYPCMIFSVFQTEISEELIQGLLLAAGSGCSALLIFFILSSVLNRPLRLNRIEQANVIYSNGGNLIIPLVNTLLGKEWLIYTIPYSVIQMVLFWSHCRILLSGEKKISLKKIFCNVNMLSIAIGAVLFSLNLMVPPQALEAIDSIGDLLGPLSMMTAGMLIGGRKLRQIFAYHGIWKVCTLRLLFFPMVMLCILKYSGIASLVHKGETILLISFLAISAPCAATPTQMAVIFGQDAEYSGAIYAVTTLLCIITMPLMVNLFQL